MKKFILGLLCGIAFTASSVVYATEIIETYLFPVKYFFNGQYKEMSAEYTTLNYNGHAYLPVRYIVESMGGTVGYYHELGTILINQPSVVQYRKDPDIGIPGIEGYITKIENQRILVVSSQQQDFNSTGGIKQFYNAVWVSNVPKEVKVGQQVQVWFQGVVLNSYPGQAMSNKIAFMPSERPNNATLSEEQVIHLAINSEGNSNIFAFVIKEVKFDESTDTWSIRYKEGVHAETEKERVLIVPDK